MQAFKRTSTVIGEGKESGKKKMRQDWPPVDVGSVYEYAFSGDEAISPHAAEVIESLKGCTVQAMCREGQEPGSKVAEAIGEGPCGDNLQDFLRAAVIYCLDSPDARNKPIATLSSEKAATTPPGETITQPRVFLDISSGGICVCIAI